MRKLALCLALAVAIIDGPAAAQPRPIDPEDTIVSEVVVRAPTQGPAWWKVSNGDSVVWIIGLPDVSLPQELDWDTAPFQRRIKGAKAFLAAPQGSVKFPGVWPELLAPPLQARVAVTSAEIGFDPDRYWPAGFLAVVNLRSDYRQKHKLTQRVTDRMETLARRSKTPILRQDQAPIYLGQAEVSLSDPEVLVCIKAMLDEVETAPDVFRANADHWSRGRAMEFLSGPRGAWPTCLNRLMPGYSRRLIGDQTAAIAEALRTPGKAVASAPIRHLVAQDGILERLRAQGFTIADPAKPLTD